MTLNWKSLPFYELSLDELYAILRLRQEVFAVEQEAAYLDLDNADQPSTHLLCHNSEGTLVAYQRCVPPGVKYTESSMGRIIVRNESRGAQLGRELVKRGMAVNLEQWPNGDICISAQAHLQDFYASLEFAPEGELYAEDGIPHRKMRYSVT